MKMERLKRKIWIMAVLLLLMSVTLVSNLPTVKASGTIYIRADGSIDPPTAPIQSNILEGSSEPPAIEWNKTYGGANNEGGLGVSEEWIATYNGPGNRWDFASAMAVDHMGNVYVTGKSDGTDMWADYATIKYDPNGDELWVRRYNGPGMYTDEASAIAIDDSGNVYVTGSSYSVETNFDYATIKYDLNGNELWVARYTGPEDGEDYARAIAVDGSGNVYVTGYIWNSGEPFTRNDYATIKYDPNGNELWVRIFDGLSQPDFLYDEASAIAVDAYGNVYVTGRRAYGSIFAYDYDYLTIKYDSSGNLLWARTYDGLGEDDDEALAITIDGSGNVYVTGASEGDGTFYDYATIKYDPNGNPLWLRRYNGPENDGDQAGAIAVDGSGNVYVTGVSGGAGTMGDYATIKYDSNGDELWVSRYDGPGNATDWPSAIAIDGSGDVYVTGRSEGDWTGQDYATIKYDTNGNELWVRRYELGVSEAAVAIALDGSGNVYVTGSSASAMSSWYVTIKYSHEGSPPVGGTVYPVNKLAILAPWIAIGAAIIAGASVLMLRRRRT